MEVFEAVLSIVHVRGWAAQKSSPRETICSNGGFRTTKICFNSLLQIISNMFIIFHPLASNPLNSVRFQTYSITTGSVLVP